MAEAPLDKEAWVREFALRRPPHLFKYIALGGEREKWAKKMIVDSEVFFPKPSQFNDPLDCQIEPSFDEDAETVRSYWRTRWQQRGEDVEAREQELQQLVQMTTTSGGRAELTRRYFAVLDTYGVTCFVPRADNFLMWSYYAASHFGIAVRFNTRDEFIAQLPEPWMPLRIHYATDFPRVTLHEPDRFRFATTGFGTKAEFWKHEEEWRFVRIGASGALKFPSGMIDGIVLGLRTKPEDIDLVREWIAEANRPIELLRVVHKPNSFLLDVMPFES